MKENDGKVRLKIRKKSSSVRIKCDESTDSPSNFNLPAQRKRSNPFSRENVKKVHHNNENTYEERSKLLDKLDSVEMPGCIIGKVESNAYKTEEGNVLDDNSDPTEKDDAVRIKEWDYSRSSFPLDWGIKQKVQIISENPLTFCLNVKSRDKAVGIKMFANDERTNPLFYQYLCCWLYPFIPGIRNFPLRKSTGEKMALGLKDPVTTDVICIDKKFQEALLHQWKISFQSLFNMLKSNLCPYFYVCGYQFSVLFKAASLGDGNVKVILTPTTKGLRAMLTEEDIPFEFANQDDPGVVTSPKIDTDENNMITADDVEYDADSFLDSIGVNKKEQFPNIEEQKKLYIKSELKRLDNRPESTIEINDGQAFFNFLLNSSLLCATSGSLAGIPPTLLSPVIFEGAACHVNKYHIGKIKQTTEKCLNCLDIYGFIIPSNLKGVVDMMKKQSTEFQVRTKGYENLFAFNTKKNETPVENDGDMFLTQVPYSISDQKEVKFIDELYKC